MNFKQTKNKPYFFRIAFAKAISKMINKKRSKYQFIIISDCRRLTDLTYFRQLCEETQQKPWLIRIDCGLEIRQKRGYSFKAGIDDAETECALDSFLEWDFCIQNDGDVTILEQELEVIVNCIFKP